MKQLTEINANEKTQDTVIDYYMSPVKINNEFAYTDKEKNIAKHKGCIGAITVYLRKDENFKEAQLVNISAFSIKKLYTEIMEIEALESEEWVDY